MRRWQRKALARRPCAARYCVSTTPASGAQESQTLSSQVIGRSTLRCAFIGWRAPACPEGEPHVVERHVAEIGDVPHLAGDRVDARVGRRVVRDPHLLRPDREPRRLALGDGAAARRLR